MTSLTMLVDDLREIGNPPVDTEIILRFQTPVNPTLVQDALRRGFRHPVVYEWDGRTYLLLYTRYNHMLIQSMSRTQIARVSAQVDFALQTYQPVDGCSVQLYFENDTIAYLYGYTNIYRFGFGWLEEQREISGQLTVQPLSKAVLVVGLSDEPQASMGQPIRTDYFETFASFHTHPSEAYVKYNLCLAYPSTDDYLTFLFIWATGKGGFHIVSCVEGLYILSIKDASLERTYVLNHLEQYKEFIKEHYYVKYPMCPVEDEPAFKREQLDAYLKHVQKQPLFEVQFVTWDRINQDPVVIRFRDTSGNCLLTDEQEKFMRLIHHYHQARPDTKP